MSNKKQLDTTSVSTIDNQVAYEMPVHKRFFTEALRSVGYDPDTAKFELIANSLDAGATQIELIYDEDNSKFIIMDNGKGMSNQTLINSMGFGVNREYGTNDTGYFGVGMKAGILNLFNMLDKSIEDKSFVATIETSDGDESSQLVYYPIVDPRKFYLAEGYHKKEQGTKIIIENTQNFSVGAFKNSIAVYFFKALSEGKARIFVSKIKNGEFSSDEVFPNDPLYRNTKELSRNWAHSLVKGSDGKEYEIKVEAVVLEDGKLERHSWDRLNKDRSGFSLRRSGIYVVYGDQYIETGGTFGIIAHHPSHNGTRIEFTIPKELTDSFPIKFNKVGGMGNIDTSTYPHLKDHVQKLKEMFDWARRTKSANGTTTPDQDVLEETDKVIKQINKAAEEANFIRPAEERGPRGPYKKDKEDEEKVEPKKAVIKNKKTFDVEFKDFADSGKFWFLTTNKGKFLITFNISHPFYTNIYLELDTKGKKFMLETLAAIAQAQYSTQINEIEMTSDIEYFWDDFWGEMSRKLHRLIMKRS